MAEPNIIACNIAGSDCIEVRNGVEKIVLEPVPVGDNQNQLAEPIQPVLLCQIAQPAAGDSPQLEKDANANTKETEANNNDSSAVLQLQEELLKRTIERDDFQKKLEETERKLSSLQSSQQQISPCLDTKDEGGLRRELEDLRSALAQTKLTLDDRERRVASQENQISALIKQVNSLKEVIAITKDMLSIRNMEVKHLQEDVDKMETKINTERQRHNDMVNKMDIAVKLNADLKTEYQTQLQLFQDLRGKYEEKVTLLSEENKALETAVQAQPAL